MPIYQPRLFLATFSPSKMCMDIYMYIYNQTIYMTTVLSIMLLIKYDITIYQVIKHTLLGGCGGPKKDRWVIALIEVVSD